LLLCQFSHDLNPNCFGNNQTITIVPIWPSKDLRGSDHRKPLLEILEMSYLPGSDHDVPSVKRSIWPVRAGYGIKTVTSEEPHGA
jgi:hypothetical protein